MVAFLIQIDEANITLKGGFLLAHIRWLDEPCLHLARQVWCHACVRFLPRCFASHEKAYDWVES
jgi:hypothetical protein